MARVLITGSAGGPGLMAGAILTRQGHTVTLHARSGQLMRDRVVFAALCGDDGYCVG